MHDNDKGALDSYAHACAQNSCESRDAFQMRMTDKETRHLWFVPSLFFSTNYHETFSFGTMSFFPISDVHMKMRRILNRSMDFIP